MIVRNIYRVFGIAGFSTETHVEEDPETQYISNSSGQFELAPDDDYDDEEYQPEEECFGFGARRG